MARNDYTRRSEKDMFWSNDTQQDIKPDDSSAPKAEGTIVPPPYKQQQPAQQPRQQTQQQPRQQTQQQPRQQPQTFHTEDFDFDKYITKNKRRFSDLTAKKKKVQIVVVVLGLIGFIATLPYSLVGIPIVMLIFVIIYDTLSYSRMYEGELKNVIKHIKKIKAFNKHCYNYKISWGSLIKSGVEADYTQDSRWDELKVSTENATTTSFALSIYKRSRSGVTPLLESECYYAEMDYKSSTADNLILLHGKMRYTRHRPRRREVSKYTLLADTEDIIDNCNTDRILDIADRIHQQINGEAFIMRFTRNSILLIVRNNDIRKYRYSFDLFDYDIPKCLRRDISMILNRVAISDILTSE